EENFVKFRAEDLPGLGNALAVVAVKKIKRFRSAPVRRNKLDAVFFDERGGLHHGNEAEAFERLVCERDERLADVIARKFFTFEEEDAMSVFRKDSRCGSTRRSSADNDGLPLIIVIHEWW